MAIVLLYSFHIVSAGRDLPFQFNKSQNLSFSIVFGFKTIIFDKFIVNYSFLSFSMGFLSNFYRLLSNFYRILSFQDDTIGQWNFIALESDLVIEIYNLVSCRQTLDRKQALSPTRTLHPSMMGALPIPWPVDLLFFIEQGLYAE